MGTNDLQGHLKGFLTSLNVLGSFTIYHKEMDFNPAILENHLNPSSHRFRLDTVAHGMVVHGEKRVKC